MSCVRESSPQSEHVVSQRPEPKKRRFHPLRGLRRIFRRKVPASPEPNEIKSFDDVLEPSSLDTSRSRSTSQLIDEPFNCRRRSLHSTLLSVSHDSVFNPEQQHSSQSDSESAVSVPRLGFPQANIQAELLAAVRRRRKIQDDDDSDDVDEEDLGLPRSPSMHSPTIATGNDLLLSKELITKSSHSTCSDFSMGSSEMDEDSFGGGAQNSRYSSKISLHEKRITSQTHLDSSDGEPSTSIPLSHSAAKHRMAIRPKRKHGNPRSKKPLTVTSALPATPEVNEEHSGRSASPETKQPRAAADMTTDGTAIITSTITTITTCTSVTATDDIADVVETDLTIGLSHDLDTSVDEISVENVVPPPRRDEGFFHRLLSRRSTKKKTANATAGAANNDSNKCVSATDEDVDVDRFLFDESTGPTRPRQREEPPPAGRMQLSYPPDLPLDHDPAYDALLPVAEHRVHDESDTFMPIKRSFIIGQRTVDDDDDNDDDDDDNDGGGGVGDGSSSSVQKSSSSDSVSSSGAVVVPDEQPVDDRRCRSYSSSDSEQQHVNGHHNRCGSPQQRPLPVPAPRLSKLYNGGGAATDVQQVIRRKKRDDRQEQQQQPELLKVFARRSLKLGKDGEPELLLLADDDCVEVATADVEVDVNENHHTSMATQNNTLLSSSSDEVAPRFKRIQQRREEWEKRLLQQ